MVTLLIRFPAKRYHANPWGSHVNEGQIEWPPSPWRLLRALLATGYSKLHWSSDRPTELACGLIEKLASVLPTYHLPDASGAHSRHYMPLTILEKGREKTALVFDTWAQINEGAIAVHWNVNVSDEEKMLLGQLAGNLGYLGRAESWVVAELAFDCASESKSTDAYPCAGATHPGAGWEQVALLAPIVASDYVSWRAEMVGAALSRLSEIDLAKKKLTNAEKKKVEAVESSYPQELVDCLQVQTSWLQKLGWSQPPGSQRALYWRRADSLETAAPKPRRKPIKAVPVEIMLLAMATHSGNEHALPKITRTLPQAELLHRALNANAARISGHSIVLSGCDSSHQPLREPHQHAHVLHLDLDNDGHLDHVLIWAPMGLDAEAQNIIRSVRRTSTKGGTAPLRLAIAASGKLKDLLNLQNPYGQNLGRLFMPSTTWRSQTPFVAPRFLKKNGRNTLEGQVCAELESRNLPFPKSINVLDVRKDVGGSDGKMQSLLSYRHFVRTRRNGLAPPVDCGFVIELNFDNPIDGPLVLGYGSHYGLGLFSSNQI